MPPTEEFLAASREAAQRDMERQGVTRLENPLVLARVARLVAGASTERREAVAS